MDNLALGYRTPDRQRFLWARFPYPALEEDKAETTAQGHRDPEFIGLEDKAFDLVSTLSQAEQKRLSIGVALISEPQDYFAG